MDFSTGMLPKHLGHAADYKRTAYFLAAAPGVTPAHVMHPDFWQHVAERLRLNDRIEIVGQNFDMDLRVVGIDPRKLWAQVRCLRLCSTDGVEVPGAQTFTDAGIASGAPDPDGFIVEWGGPVHKWRIVHGRDLIAKGFTSKEEAQEALLTLKSAHKARAA